MQYKYAYLNKTELNFDSSARNTGEQASAGIMLYTHYTEDKEELYLADNMVIKLME